MQLKKYTLLNKHNRICSNILVIISDMTHYEVAKDSFTVLSLIDLQTLKVFQGSYSNPILNYAFDF